MVFRRFGLRALCDFGHGLQETELVIIRTRTRVFFEVEPFCGINVLLVGIGYLCWGHNYWVIYWTIWTVVDIIYSCII